MSDAPQVVVVEASEGPRLSLVGEGGEAHAIIWPGMGAELRSFHRIYVPGGGRTVDLRHPGESAYYVISGGGEIVDLDLNVTTALVEGSTVHIDGGTGYAIVGTGTGIEVVGGPAPPDPSLYELLEA